MSNRSRAASIVGLLATRDPTRSDLRMSDPRTDEPDPRLTRCAYCHRPIAPDEPSIIVMRAGEPIASYHEACRPDRRKSGCAGC